MEELQQANSNLQDQNTLLRAQLSTAATLPEQISIPVQDADLREKLLKLEAEEKEKAEELERLRKDQEDLLELLTEQDLKLNAFKYRLRELGENIEDADSDNNSASSDVEIEQ